MLTSKRILIATIGSLGDLYPYLALASALQKRGHRITIASSAHHRRRIEHSGFAFHKMAPDCDFSNAEFQARVLVERKGGERLLRVELFPHIRASYDDLLKAAGSADLLVTQMLTYAGPLVAGATGLPWVSTVLAPLSFFSYRDSPVLGTQIIGLREKYPRLNGLINRVARSTTSRWGEPIWQLRRELGLPRGGDPIFEGQHSPNLVLAMFSPVLAQKQEDWPSQTVITGFPFWDEPSTGIDPGLDRFLSEGAKPIVFTLGSSAVLDPGSFYADSVEAARRLGRRAILLDNAGGTVRQVTPDIIAIGYAPHSYLFSKAAACVHSAGVGTCAQALRAGCPMLTVPYSHDQPDNSARLARMGVALNLGRFSYTAKRAAKKLDLLLTDPRYRENAERIGGMVQAEDGTGAACAALEDFLTLT